MTTFNIFGGPLKRELVKDAYGWCGQSDTEYELTADEYDRALGLLESMMAEWLAAYGIDLGWNFAPNGNGSPDDESGIPPGARQVVSSQLALRVGSTIGKQVSLPKWAGESFGNLRSAYSSPPKMQPGRGTPAGRGNRWLNDFWGPFFPVGCQPAATPGYSPTNTLPAPPNCDD